MFLVSLLTGSLASKLKSHAKNSAQVAWRARLLLKQIRSCKSTHTGRNHLRCCGTTSEDIPARYRCLSVESRRTHGASGFSANGEISRCDYTGEQERKVAQWVLANNKRAGAGTETFSDSYCTYFSVRTGDQSYGVVGIAASEKQLDSFEVSLLLSVLSECALAVENQRNIEEKEATAVLAKMNNFGLTCCDQSLMICGRLSRLS